MDKSIKTNYEVASGFAQKLLFQFSEDHIMQDGISNIPAVLKGHSQDELGRAVGTEYESLLTKDVQKIAALNDNFKYFDQSIANNLSSLTNFHHINNAHTSQHKPLIFRETNS